MPMKRSHPVTGLLALLGLLFTFAFIGLGVYFADAHLRRTSLKWREAKSLGWAHEAVVSTDLPILVAPRG